MKIYTRTGDKGQTSVIGGRVSKDDVRVEAYGTVDELNAFVGQALAMIDKSRDAELGEHLLQVQQELFDCGSDLALLKAELRPYKVNAGMVELLEQWIDRYNEETPVITKFILPGGTPLAAALHVCRTVCRRAERRIVALSREQEINTEVLRYVNRLSDLFFVWARVANVRAGQEDISYARSADVFRHKRT